LPDEPPCDDRDVMNHVLLALTLLVACKSGLQPDKTSPQPGSASAAPAADPACAAKAKELEPFLAGLLVEEATAEINMGWAPVVVDREARPARQDIDNVTITPKTVSAYDASESNHVDNNIEPNTKPEVAKARLAKTFEMKVEKQRGPDDVLRVDVDKDATWGEVVRIVDAAAGAGYKQAVFTFEATSKLTAPAGVEPLTTSEDVHRQANERLEVLKKQCEGWSNAYFAMKHVDDKVEDQKAFAKEIADGIAKCNCPFDLDEVRTTFWKAKRWHQAHSRVPVAIELGATAIEQAAATPWSEAHKALLDAKGGVKLVAK
jgi:hypothetical protein